MREILVKPTLRALRQLQFAESIVHFDHAPLAQALRELRLIHSISMHAPPAFSSQRLDHFSSARSRVASNEKLPRLSTHQASDRQQSSLADHRVRSVAGPSHSTLESSQSARSMRCEQERATKTPSVPPKYCDFSAPLRSSTTSTPRHNSNRLSPQGIQIDSTTAKRTAPNCDRWLLPNTAENRWFPPVFLQIEKHTNARRGRKSHLQAFDEACAIWTRLWDMDSRRD